MAPGHVKGAVQLSVGREKGAQRTDGVVKLIHLSEASPEPLNHSHLLLQGWLFTGKETGSVTHSNMSLGSEGAPLSQSPVFPSA